MVSLRFPFFSHSTTTARFPSFTFSPATIACSVAVGGAISAGISISNNTNSSLLNSFISNFSRSSPLWGSLSLSDAPPAVVTESKTGVSFPAVLNGSQGLLGIGLRKKAVLGLKNIDVYAFGI
ncbi:putative fatty-acid-binding protein [Helianthus annuus]|nr:putative fatty-acid-binding protein [Helianthus annuus]